MAQSSMNTMKHRKAIYIPFQYSNKNHIAFAWKQPFRIGVYGSGKAEPMILDPIMLELAVSVSELTKTIREFDIYGSILQAGTSVSQAELDMGTSHALYHADKFTLGKLDPLALETNYLDIE